MQLAYKEDATQIWVVNVGDLKPVEVPMSFFFDLAWNPESITAGTLQKYFENLASREFGVGHSAAIGAAWFEFDRLIALRKHEHIEPETFSLLRYHEAESIVERWRILLKSVESLNKAVEEKYRPAFFQLVLYPVKASYLYVNLRVTQYKNQLFAKQRRNTTNVLFHKCLSLFDEDHQLVEEYHSVSNGKWNHIIRQPHYGYAETFRAPARDMISGLCYVQTKSDSNPSTGQMGVSVEGHEGVHPGLINEDSDRTHPPADT